MGPEGEPFYRPGVWMSRDGLVMFVREGQGMWVIEGIWLPAERALQKSGVDQQQFSTLREALEVWEALAEDVVG